MWYDETLNHSKWIIHKVTEFSQSITSKRTLDQVTVSSQTRISGITKSRSKNSNAKLKAKVQKFMKAGRADIYRIIHSSLGIASLVIGSSHLFHIAFLHDFLANNASESMVFRCIINGMGARITCPVFHV